MQYAYKGVDQNLHTNCGTHGYTFEIGKWHEVEEKDTTVMCHNYGFHCAKNPLDCYKNMGRVFLVAVDGDVDEEDNMLCATKIKLIKELSDIEFVAHAMKFVQEHPLLPNKNIKMANNKYISKKDDYVIVRGENPKVKAEKNTIVGIIKDGANGNIEAMNLYISGKDGYKANTYYDVFGKAVC